MPTDFDKKQASIAYEAFIKHSGVTKRNESVPAATKEVETLKVIKGTSDQLCG